MTAMDAMSGGARTDWLPWTVALPGIAALAEAVLLGTIGWWGVGFGVGSTCTDDFSCGSTSCAPCASFNAWWIAGGVGEWVLGVAAVVLLIFGLRRPGVRRGAAFTAWSLVPLAVVWMIIWTVQAEHSF
jgi:hypothetical protein